MKMTLLDKSECYRAFLLLIRQDRSITTHEREVLLKIGRLLDLDPRFSGTSIDDVLENRFINTEPPQFSRLEFAESFLKDAIRIASADDQFHQSEFEWILSIAVRNGLDKEWVEKELQAFRKNPADQQVLHILEHL
jgi:hypothetical protein